MGSRDLIIGGPRLDQYRMGRGEFGDPIGDMIAELKENDMADKAAAIIGAAIKVAPIVFEWAMENFTKLAKGQMTPQEVREALAPIADTETRAAKLDAILNSEAVADAYERASDVLDTD